MQLSQLDPRASWFIICLLSTKYSRLLIFFNKLLGGCPTAVQLMEMWKAMLKTSMSSRRSPPVDVPVMAPTFTLPLFVI